MYAVTFEPPLTDALMKVFSQCITIPTFTLITTNLIHANVVTTTVIGVTFIDI